LRYTVGVLYKEQCKPAVVSEVDFGVQGFDSFAKKLVIE
jgi:hypothetical protein